MKKTLSIILVLTFVLSMCTFTFVRAEETKSTIPGFSNQIGKWEKTENGIKSVEKGSLIVLDKEMDAGYIQFKVDIEAANQTRIYVKGTGFDTLTATTGIGTATPSYCAWFQPRGITLLNNTATKYGDQDIYQTNFDNENILGANWKDLGAVDVRIEFADGGFSVYVGGRKMGYCDPASAGKAKATGTQIAIWSQTAGLEFTDFEFGSWISGDTGFNHPGRWTFDCDSATNAASAQGFASNTNVNAPAGSVVEFDVTADTFNPCPGNNAFFIGGNGLYGASNAEKGQNYWMFWFGGNSINAIVMNGSWGARYDAGYINYADKLPAEPGATTTLHITASYTGNSATVKVDVVGGGTVEKTFTIPEGALTADTKVPVVAPNGSEVAFRVWGGKAMTYSNLKVDGKKIDGHATDMDGVCQKCGWDTTMFSNVLGEWEAVEGGVKANSSGLIVFDKQMKAGVFETTVTKGATFGNEINIFVNGSGFDVLENLADQRAKTASYQTMFYGAVKCIGFYNHYSNGWKGGAGLDGATGGDFTKFPYDTYVGGADGFANPSFKIRIEFGSGGVRVLVDGKVVVDNVYPADKQATTTNTEIKSPTGTQIAIMADDDTFTNFKFSPWDATNDAAWTSDCDSITNTTMHNGFAYNGNVSAPEGSVLSFDVTAASFKEGTGNNGFLIGGDHLYGSNNAEKTTAIGKGMNYWLIYFNNNNTMQLWVINGHWNGRYQLPAADFSSIIPENPGNSITINVNAVYSGRTLTLVLSCGDKSTTIERTIAEGAVRADNGPVIAPNGSEVAFRSWNSGSAMTFGNIKVDGKAINEHVLTKVDAVKESCTESGTVAYYECEKCNKKYANADGTGLLTSIVAPPHAHTMTHHAEEPETCTAAGVKEYWACSECGKNYATATGGEVLTDLVIPAHAHTMTHHVAAGESCTAAGNVEYWACSECGKNYKTATGGEVIDDITVAPHAHTMTHHAKEPETCTATGVKEYWACSECGKNYATATGGEVLTDLVIPAHAHTMTHHEATGNSCTENGTLEHWACSECGKNYDSANGGNVIDNVNVNALGHEMTHYTANDATCTEDGNHEYWACSRCKKNFADADGRTEIAETVIPALGHDMIHNKRVAPTCTEPGTKEFWTCKNCSKNFADADGNEVIVNLGISALGHDLIHHESTSTCMEAGNGEYWECDECGLIFADEDGKQEIDEIPAGQLNDNHVNTTDDATVGHDEYSHWYECECGDILDTDEHDEEGANGECSVCGYKAPAAETGDMTAIIAIVAIVAALGCGVVFTVSKKRI